MLLESYREIIIFYKDMVTYLQMLKNAEVACETALKAMQQFSYNKVSFVNDIDDFKNLISTATTLDGIIAGIEDNIERVEQHLSEVDGIDAQVVYMRDVEKKKLYEIADELGYAYDHIRRVSSRNSQCHN